MWNKSQDVQLRETTSVSLCHYSAGDVTEHDYVLADVKGRHGSEIYYSLLLKLTCQIIPAELRNNLVL